MANDADRVFDLIVIGAGINGAAIAREAALRGLEVLVLEQGDVCSGTTAWSSRLIHGGLRYLEHAELSLVYESLHERERLLSTASHLVAPLGMYIPIYRTGRRARWQIRAGMVLYDLLSLRKRVPRHRMLSARALRERIPGLRTDGLLGGAYYFDAQVEFPERLVVENLKDAVAHGARLETYTPVTGVIAQEGRVRGVRWRDTSGTEGRALASVVVNAAGPWADHVVEGVSSHRLIGGTKGSHLVVEPFPGVPDAALYVEASSDGRPFFIIPWNGLLLIGTTDQRYEGDPGRASISEDEFRYLVAETERVFPGLRDLPARVLYAQSGIRPLPYTPGGAEGTITRRHLIRDHEGARGLYSIVGGKLTTHRALAEDFLAKAAKALGLSGGSSLTRHRNLPGAAPPAERDSLLQELSARLGGARAQRLWRIYGRGAADILAGAARDPELSAEICPYSGTIAAELVHARDAEWAVTLGDMLERRCMAGLGPDHGLAAARAAAEWLQRSSIWDRARAEREVADYVREAARFRVRTSPVNRPRG